MKSIPDSPFCVFSVFFFCGSLKVQFSLIDEYLAMGTVGPKGFGVSLQGFTTRGVQSHYDLNENDTPWNCSVDNLCNCRCGPV